jgi:hypothetical protein
LAEHQRSASAVSASSIAADANSRALGILLGDVHVGSGRYRQPSAELTGVTIEGQTARLARGLIGDVTANHRTFRPIDNKRRIGGEARDDALNANSYAHSTPHSIVHGNAIDR